MVETANLIAIWHDIIEIPSSFLGKFPIVLAVIGCVCILYIYLRRNRKKPSADSSEKKEKIIDVETEEAHAQELLKKKNALDETHYGLQDTKSAIFVNLESKCFVKPSLILAPPRSGVKFFAQSLAAVLERKCVEISLENVSTSAELDEKVFNAIMNSNSANPVVLMKSTELQNQSLQAALCEMFDSNAKLCRGPWKNFDLSSALFILSVASLTGITQGLWERINYECIPEYNFHKKLYILQRYLIPNIQKTYGLTSNNVEIKLPAVRDIAIRSFIARLPQRGIPDLNCLMKIVIRRAIDEKENRFVQTIIDKESVNRILPNFKIGRLMPSIISPNKKFEENEFLEPGMSMGLLCSLYEGYGSTSEIQTTTIESDGMNQITGSVSLNPLDPTFKESAQTAFNWVNKYGRLFNIQKISPVQMHFLPEGVPKDGPSAGVAVATALVSLHTGRRVRRDTAITGGISLDEHVREVGGILQKILGAYYSGYTRVILPHANLKEALALPEEIKECVTLVYHETVKGAIESALEKESDQSPITMAQ